MVDVDSRCHCFNVIEIILSSGKSRLDRGRCWLWLILGCRLRPLVATAAVVVVAASSKVVLAFQQVGHKAA